MAITGRPRGSRRVQVAIVTAVVGATFSAWAADRPAVAIAGELQRLASTDANEAQMALARLIEIGAPAMPGLVETLSHQREEVRARAAQAIRTILATNPAAAPNDYGEAYWKKKLDQIKPGMSYDEVKKRLAWIGEGGGGSGPSMGLRAQLDDYWAATIDFWGMKIGENKPRLEKHIMWASGANTAPTLPKDYTGRWTLWYVNGQKYEERQYRSGKPHGLVTGYYADGRKWDETQFVDGAPVGTNTSWYPDGNKQADKTFDHGKATRRRQWYEDGTLQSAMQYRNGKMDGTDEVWYPTGQKQREVQYRDGKKHGFDREWDEQGQLLWERRFDDGTMVELK